MHLPKITRTVEGGSTVFELTPESAVGAHLFDDDASLGSTSATTVSSSTSSSVSPEAQLIVFIRTKIVRLLRLIKSQGKKNAQLLTRVNEQQQLVEDTTALVEAMEEKCRGLKATLECLIGVIQTEEMISEVPNTDITEIPKPPPRIRLPKLQHVDPTIVFAPEIPPEIQATLLVERLNACERLKETIDRIHDLLLHQIKLLEPCVSTLQNRQKDLQEQIDELEMGLQEFTISEKISESSSTTCKDRGTPDTSLDSSHDDIPVESIQFPDSYDMDVFGVRESYSKSDSDNDTLSTLSNGNGTSLRSFSLGFGKICFSPIWKH